VTQVIESPDSPGRLTPSDSRKHQRLRGAHRSAISCCRAPQGAGRGRS
jgi:hypothetical protein